MQRKSVDRILVVLAVCLLAVPQMAAAGAGRVDVAEPGPVAVAPELPWPADLPDAPLTYVLVTENASGSRQEQSAVVANAHPVDVTGDGRPDLVVRVDPTGPASFRFTVARADDVPVPALVAAVLTHATHPLIPVGEAALLGADGRAGSLPDVLALDAGLDLTGGVTLGSRVDGGDGALALLVARDAEDAGAHARFLLDPVPPRFSADVWRDADGTALRLTTADAQLPAVVPDAAPPTRFGASATEAAHDAGVAAASGVADAPPAPVDVVRNYWNGQLAPYVETFVTGGRPVPRLPAGAEDVQDAVAPASRAVDEAAGTARDAGGLPDSTAESGWKGLEPLEGTVPGWQEHRDAVAPRLAVAPVLDAAVALGRADTPRQVVGLLVDALPGRVELVERAGERVAYEASAPVDRIVLSSTSPALAEEVVLEGVPESLSVAWGEDGATLETSAPVGRLAYARTTTGTFQRLDGDHVLVDRTGGGDVLSVSLRQVTALDARVAADGSASWLAIEHAGGPFRVLVADDSQRFDATVTDLPALVRVETDMVGGVAVTGNAPIARVHAQLVDVANARSYALTLVDAPATFAVGVADGGRGVSWTASDRTGRVALVAFSPDGGLGGFARVAATLVDVPPAVTLSVNGAGAAALDAPGAIGRLEVTASASRGDLPVPAHGMHYRDDGSSRAFAVGLDGVRAVAADAGSSSARVRIAAAAGGVLTALVERPGERVDVAVHGVPGDLTVAHVASSTGSRTEFSANARATLVRATITGGGESTRVEFANVPSYFVLDQSQSSSGMVVSYNANGRGDRLEAWRTSGGDSLWMRLANPVPASLRFETSTSSGRSYRLDASEHVTVDVRDTKANGAYTIVENLRVRKVHVTYDGGSSGSLSLDTDNHNVVGRVKSESGSSGFELDVRGHLRAQDFRVKWWSYIPYSTSGSLSVSDTTVRIKSGGSWYRIDL